MAQEARRALTRAAAALVLAVAISAASAAGSAKKGPVWAELTVDQQQVLEPLKPHWERLDTDSKKKWVGVARRYPNMTPTGQQRVQTRMEKWVKLTPEQRRAAREQYKSIGKLPAERRMDLRQQWAEYQALPPGEKRMLDAPSTTDARDARKRRSSAKPPPTPLKPSPTTK